MHHKHLMYTHAQNGYQKETQAKRRSKNEKKIVTQVMRSALEEAIYATTTETSTEKRSQIRIQLNATQHNTTHKQIDTRRWKGENINWIITTARWGRRQLRWLQSIYGLVVKPRVTALKPCTGYAYSVYGFFLLSLSRSLPLVFFILFYGSALISLLHLINDSVSSSMLLVCCFFLHPVVFLNKKSFGGLTPSEYAHWPHQS